MDYLIEVTPSTVDLTVVEEVLRALDPGALVDLDPRRQLLRVSGALSEADLLGLLEDAGLDVEEHHIHRQPSVCCGGCGG